MEQEPGTGQVPCWLLRCNGSKGCRKKQLVKNHIHCAPAIPLPGTYPTETDIRQKQQEQKVHSNTTGNRGNRKQPQHLTTTEQISKVPSPLAQWEILLREVVRPPGRDPRRDTSERFRDNPSHMLHSKTHMDVWRIHK